MALPTHLQKTFTPEEIEFLTESELVTIYPQYTSKSIDLITDQIPNMYAGHRMEVPLWYALVLKKQRKCRIFPPDWLKESRLEEFLKEEKKNIGHFTNLPFNWLELSKIFFTYAFDDFENLEIVPKLKQLVMDLKEIRAIKVHTGLATIDDHYIQMDNLSRMEINEIRGFVTDVMAKHISLKKAVSSNGDQDDEDAIRGGVSQQEQGHQDDGEDDDMGYEDDGYQYNYDQ